MVHPEPVSPRCTPLLFHTRSSIHLAERSHAMPSSLSPSNANHVSLFTWQKAMEEEYDMDNPAVISFLVKMQQGHQAKLEAQGRDGHPQGDGGGSGDGKDNEGDRGPTEQESGQSDEDNDQVCVCPAPLPPG